MYSDSSTLLLGAYKGTGVYVRNSGGQTDDKCYTPAGVCSSDALASFANHMEVVEYSTNASTTLSSESKLQTVLTYCPLQNCGLFASDCSTASTLTRVTMAGAYPWTITVNQADTLEQWQESQCIKCTFNA